MVYKLYELTYEEIKIVDENEDKVLASFGFLFIGYCIFAISAGRLQIRRPKNWHDPRKDFTREKTTFAYYFVVLVLFIISIIMIVLELI